MDPLVSIIIPVYNASDYMKEAIDSALAQTYSSIEILVVNDGSTDGGKTREIALSYGNKIRYFEQDTNQGVSTVLNIGIQNMRGQFFSRLSHDDVYYPNKIQMEIDALRKNGNMDLAVYSDWVMLKMPTREIFHCSSMKRFSERYLHSGLCAIVLGFIAGPSLLIPKNYFKQYGFFDPNLLGVQDYAKWFEMFHDKHLVYVDRVLVQVRSHEKQVTNTYTAFEQERDELHLQIMKSIRSEDIETFGMDLYQFYSGILLWMEYNDFTRTKAYLYQQLNFLQESPKTDELCEDFNNWLHGLGGKGVYLYSIGRHGQKWLRALLMRNIQIDGISDTDPQKWGKKFYGMTCQKPSDLPYDALIIITNAEPSPIKCTLDTMGFRFIVTYEDLEERMFETPVKKSQIARFDAC